MRSLALFFGFSLISIVLFSCSQQSPTSSIVKNSFDFDISRHLSAKQSFLLQEPSHYSFIYHLNLFLSKPLHYTVTVKNHLVTAIETDTTQYLKPQLTSFYDSQSVSIIAWFDEITSVYEINCNQYVDKNNVYMNGLFVVYDSLYSFPSRCSWSFYIPPNVETDGDTRWFIDSFKVLP